MQIFVIELNRPVQNSEDTNASDVITIRSCDHTCKQHFQYNCYVTYVLCYIHRRVNCSEGVAGCNCTLFPNCLRCLVNQPCYRCALPQCGNSTIIQHCSKRDLDDRYESTDNDGTTSTETLPSLAGKETPAKHLKAVTIAAEPLARIKRLINLLKEQTTEDDLLAGEQATTIVTKSTGVSTDVATMVASTEPAADAVATTPASTTTTESTSITATLTGTTKVATAVTAPAITEGLGPITSTATSTPSTVTTTTSTITTIAKTTIKTTFPVTSEGSTAAETTEEVGKQFHTSTSPAKTEILGISAGESYTTTDQQMECTDYSLCEYCYFCATCEDTNCGDCDLTQCTDVDTLCTCHDPTVLNLLCESAECFHCSESMKDKACLSHCDWEDEGIGQAYSVAYHVIIRGLEVTSLESGVFDPLSPYLESIYLEKLPLTGTIEPFDTRPEFPHLALFTLNNSNGGCDRIIGINIFHKLTVGVPYLDVTFSCPYRQKPYAMQSSFIEDMNETSRIRKLKLLDVFSTFTLSLCTLGNFFLNKIPGRELWLGRQTEVTCDPCDSNFLTRFVKGGDNPFPNPDQIEFYQDAKRSLLPCPENMLPFHREKPPCHSDSNSERPPWTHKCHRGRYCPLECLCTASHLECSTGPLITDEGTYADIIVENYDYWFLKTLQQGYLTNITLNRKYYLLQRKPLRLRILAIRSLKAIEKNAFAGYERNITVLEIHKNSGVTDLPRGLVSGLVNTQLMDVTHNGLGNLYFLEGLRSLALTKLYLNNNKIFSIGRKSLIGLFSLVVLRLHDNKIAHLDFCELNTFLWTPREQEIFAESNGTSKVIKDKVMTLSGNKLKCGCSLAFFRRFVDPVAEEFVDDAPITLRWETVQGAVPPTCADHRDKVDRHLLVTEFRVYTERCVNTRKLSCNCIIPANEQACGCGYCANGGICDNDLGACNCARNYTGPSCMQHIKALPTCGLQKELRCHNAANCQHGLCVCRKGWSGPECDLAVACVPNPCKVWQRCYPVSALVNTNRLTDSIKTYLQNQIQCLDTTILVQQMFHSAQSRCTDKNDDKCKSKTYAECTYYNAEFYCACPLETPYNRNQDMCSHLSIKCETTEDCRSLTENHLCTSGHVADHSKTEELHHDGDEFYAHRHCLCVNVSKRNSFTGQCTSPRESELQSQEEQGIEWKLHHILLIVACVSVVIAFVLLTIKSYGNLGTFGGVFRVWEERLRTRLLRTESRGRGVKPKARHLGWVGVKQGVRAAAGVKQRGAYGARTNLSDKWSTKDTASTKPRRSETKNAVADPVNPINERESGEISAGEQKHMKKRKKNVGYPSSQPQGRHGARSSKHRS